MKKAFLLMVVPMLLAAVAFAQTPAADKTDQTNIKGCLGGSDGNYTVVEDNTGHIFKISASSVDLKPHVGHDVTLIGQRASEASSAADAHSFAVTELKMISEQCAAAAAAPAATVAPPAETAVPPAAAAATAPAATVAASAEIAAAPAPIATEPAATVTPPAETAVTPAPAAAEPAATIAAPAEIASTPAVAVHAKPAGRRVSATPAAVAAASQPVSTSPPPTTAPTTAPTATTSPETDSAPAAAPTMPAKTAKTGSFAIFIAFAVLVILLGILTPFLRRWRKQRMLEGTDAPNLSFTHDAKSDEDKSDPPVTRKAA